MGCGCNKNKNKNNDQPANGTQQPVEFRKAEPIKKEGGIKEKMTMMQSFASAIASRGFNN